MTHGPERARLRQYLSGAKHEATDSAGENWRTCGILLQDTARAIRDGAKKVRDGDGTDDGLSGVTAQAVLDAFHASATSMQDKGTRLVAAGDVLTDAARVMRNAQAAEAGMADLQQPEAYTPPNYSPGYTPTAEQIKAEGDKRQDANQKMADYNTARTRQEAAATEWTQKLDAVFLESIPTMQAIHGQPDPTEPPPSSPSSPTSPSVPLTPSTPGVPSDPDRPDPTKPDDPDQDKDPDRDRDEDKDQDPVPPRPPVICPPLDPTHPITNPTTVPTISTETTNVSGNQQSGVTYQGPQVSTPTTSGGSGGAGGSGGMNAAAFGAAGAAGGASGMMGGVRAGSASASAGSAPTRPIGATGRSGNAGALSRPAASSGSPAARSGAAGSPGSRGAASGSTAGRGGAGSAGARGAGSAGSRGAGTAGARGVGSAGGRGAGAAAGRGGRKGDRDEAQQRDSLVYDQDWLGDDDVAPGVLD
jgi:hypothetical protein